MTQAPSPESPRNFLEVPSVSTSRSSSLGAEVGHLPFPLSSFLFCFSGIFFLSPLSLFFRSILLSVLQALHFLLQQPFPLDRIFFLCPILLHPPDILSSGFFFIVLKLSSHVRVNLFASPGFPLVLSCVTMVLRDVYFLLRTWCLISPR